MEKQSGGIRLKKAWYINILSGIEEEQTSALYLTNEDKGVHV